MSTDRGRVLLRIARQAIANSFDRSSGLMAREPWLDDPGATFVTLMKDRNLRGCIGTLIASRPLWQDVTHNARAAAFEDPRFPALTPSELPSVRIEISLLSALESIPARSETELLSSVRPGLDGLVVDYGAHRGTFLPQVWDQFPEPQAFIRHLKQKADLEDRFWSPEMRWSRYTVTKWQETDAEARVEPDV